MQGGIIYMFNSLLPKEVQLYREKIYFEILKPVMHYYGVNYDDEIINSFCKSLSFYKYQIIVEVRDELLREYKTFPKLPNWIRKCKEKLNDTNLLLNISKELKETIEKNNSNKHFIYFKIEIQKQIGTSTFNSWFKDVFLIQEKDNYILLSVPTEFVADYIVRNFMNGTRVKNVNGEYYFIKKGIKEVWQEANPNINKIELKTLTSINNSFKSSEVQND